MKYILLFFSLYAFTTKLAAQKKFTVVVDSFYNFKFDRRLSASDALNNNEFVERPGSVGETQIMVNENNETITLKFEGQTHILKMLGNPNGNKDAYIYTYLENGEWIKGQMSFVSGDGGGQYIIAEAQDKKDPDYQIAWIAKIR